MTIDVVVASLASLIASVAIVAAVRAWAPRLGLLDHPNQRSLHARATPRGGGIGIAVPVCVVIGIVALTAPEAASPAMWLLAGSALMAAVGLTDDIRGLSPVVRLVAHIVAAALVVVAIGTWHTVSWPGLAEFDLAWVALPFTVFVVTGFVNAFNFMDGIDGIAGSQAVIAGIGWVGLGYSIQDPVVAVTGAAITGASLGFLRFNWSPASIFMGDVGSYFLGFLLTALPVHVAQRSPAAAMAGVLFVWPFIFDATFTFIRRAVRRERLFSAHRSHLYQRLVLTGASHRTMTLVYAGLAVIGVAVGHAVANDFQSASVAGALLVGGLAFALWLTAVRRERSQRQS